MNHVKNEMVNSGKGLENWSVAGYSALPHLAAERNLKAREMDKRRCEDGNGVRGNI